VSALKSDGVLKWLKLFTFMSERTPCGKKHKFLAMRQRTQILGQKNPYPSNFCLHHPVCLCYPNYLEPTSCLHLCIAISIRTSHRYRTLSRLWVGPNQILFFLTRSLTILYQQTKTYMSRKKCSYVRVIPHLTSRLCRNELGMNQIL